MEVLEWNGGLHLGESHGASASHRFRSLMGSGDQCCGVSMSLTFLLSEQRNCSGVGYSGKRFIRHTPKASQQPAPTTPAPLQWPEMPAEASVDPYSSIRTISDLLSSYSVDAGPAGLHLQAAIPKCKAVHLQPWNPKTLIPSRLRTLACHKLGYPVFQCLPLQTKEA